MRCKTCNGDGVKTDDNGIKYDDACPNCNGTGEVEEET